MERSKLCSERYISPVPANNQTTGYSKLHTYNTPLCKPFRNEVFLEEQEPNLAITQDMCRSNNECKNTNNYTYLNQRGVKQSPYFKQQTGLYVPTDYVSKIADARVVDSTRNYVQELDIKPIQVVYNSIRDNISGNPELKDYGKNYKGYSTVTGGQIQYYIDKELAEPFNKPVYAAKTKAVGFTYKDPMDAIKPQFEKQYPTESFTGLSWLDDSCSFRDDITARQQRTHNEQRYELVYNRL